MPKRRRCNSCQLLRINGTVCHEIGCPDAWKDYRRDCKECGDSFKPEDRHQTYCKSCMKAIYK